MKTNNRNSELVLKPLIICMILSFRKLLLHFMPVYLLLCLLVITYLVLTSLSNEKVLWNRLCLLWELTKHKQFEQYMVVRSYTVVILYFDCQNIIMFSRIFYMHKLVFRNKASGLLQCPVLKMQIHACIVCVCVCWLLFCL